MRELPAIDNTAALGWLQHTVRPLLRPVDSFGPANAGCARGNVRGDCPAPADLAIEGSGVAGAAAARCAGCSRQAQAGGRPMTRVHAARQLLAHGPLSMGDFIAITGWTQMQARRTVSHMSETGIIRPVNLGGRRCHALASPVILPCVNAEAMR